MPSSCSACLTTPSPGSWPPGSLRSLLLLHLLPSNSLSPSHLLSIQGSHPLQPSPLDFIAFSPEPLHFLQVHESLQSLLPFPSASHHTLHHFIHSLQPLRWPPCFFIFPTHLPTSTHRCCPSPANPVICVVCTYISGAMGSQENDTLYINYGFYKLMVHLFNIYQLNTYCVPDTGIRSKHMNINKMDF